MTHHKQGLRRTVSVNGVAIAIAAVAFVPAAAQDKPNILVIWGDDIGQSNISAYTRGLMGYQTPNIDRIAREGILFTDYYGEQSCTAGRSSFMLGQSVFRTGLSKVGLPGAKPQLAVAGVDEHVPGLEARRQLPSRFRILHGRNPYRDGGGDGARPTSDSRADHSSLPTATARCAIQSTSR